jgi:hypothetical protein
MLQALALAAALLAATPFQKQGPHETRTSFTKPPSYEHATSPPTFSFASAPDPFRIVQVNVNAQGQNIVGDAANEPSIALDPNNPNKLAIGWRQFDTITSDFREAGYGYTQDGGWTWTFPGVIDNGIFRSDPVLDADPDGTFYYFSLHTDQGNLWRVDVFSSLDGGATWTGPTFGYGGDKLWMTVDKSNSQGRSHLYSAWNTAGNQYTPRTFSRSTNRASTFENPIEIPNRPIFGSVATGPAGELYVFGRSPGGASSFFLDKSTNALDPQQTPTFTSRSVVMGGSQGISSGPNPAGLLGQAWVAVNHGNGHVYLLCSVNPSGTDPMDVNFVRSFDGGQTFTAPKRLNDDTVGNNAWQWFGTMSVAPNGRIDVIWLDTRQNPGGNQSRLYYTYSFDEGTTWVANIPVGPSFNHTLGWPQQNKLGDYFHMLSDDSGGHLAYAATYNGEQDVYYVYLTPGTPATLTGFQVVDGSVLSGGLAEIQTANNQYLTLASFTGASLDEADLSTLIVTADTDVQNPTELDIRLELKAGRSDVFGRLAIKNWSTGFWDSLGEYPIKTTDTLRISARVPAANHIRADGAIEIRSKAILQIPNITPFFTAATDQVQIIVR